MSSNYCKLHLLATTVVVASRLGAADISPQQVERDVFGALITERTLVNGQDFQLRFEGFPALPYEIQSSSNLLDWAVVATNVATGGSALFQEPLAAEGSRFYRVAFNGANTNDPPQWPAGPAMAVIVLDSTGVDIDIHLANDDAGVVAYALYQDGQLRATLAPNELNAFVGGLKPNNLYEFDVFACDTDGNCTKAPDTLRVRTRTVSDI